MNNKEQLKSYLLSTLTDAREASGGRQIVCRCLFPNCTDTKRHLYIGPFDDSDSPILYNCFKCTRSGIVNKAFLKSYGLNESSIDNDIIESNSGSSDYRTYTKSNDYIYNINYDFITDSEITERKLKYINDRLGIHLTYNECISNKIVLNLVDILKINNLKPTRDMNIIRDLNRYFIGFLSRSNSTLNMRNLNMGNVISSIDKKYINYKLFDSNIKNDFYIIPNNIDYNRKVIVYIGEGPFDILSIRYNLIKSMDNTLYIAGRGKAYYQIVSYLITNGIWNMEIHFFPDKDIEDMYIDSIAKYFSPFRFDIYIHRNRYKNNKDYGVPMNNIIDGIRKYNG